MLYLVYLKAAASAADLSRQAKILARWQDRGSSIEITPIQTAAAPSQTTHDPRILVSGMPAGWLPSWLLAGWLTGWLAGRTDGHPSR